MESYAAIAKALSHIQLPRFCQVRYQLPLAPAGFDAAAEARRALAETGVLERIRPGESVAVTVSSREVDQMAVVLRALVELLKQREAKPFLFPAMGSHGGATAEGQRAVAAGYGITEESIGCPLLSSMDVTLIGHTPGKGLPVNMDKHAAAADHIIPVGRIKPHTDFRGKVESGLMKMLTIGCGKQQGAFLCHQRGWHEMADNVFDIAAFILQSKSIPFGLGIIEDSAHHAAQVHAVPGQDIPTRESQLLEIAKSYIPRVPFDKVDVLFVDEIGKDVSGAGMDPNVTGRSAQMGQSEPFIERIVIRALTKASKHNAAGVGNGDVVTRRLFDDMDMPASYINSITSHDAVGCKIPPVMENDELAFRYALEFAAGADPATGPKVVWIQNTSHMGEFLISENLRAEAEANPRMTVSPNSRAISFDENGNVAALIEEEPPWESTAE